MTIELSANLVPFCRYAPGHPFKDPRNPDGFHFNMLEAREPFRGARQYDQLFIDFDGVAGVRGPAGSLEEHWYCFERND